MLNQQFIKEKYPQFSYGMEVRSLDNERLGKVSWAGDDAFTVEKGIFFPKDFTARYDDIEDIRDDVIYIKHGQSALSDWRNEEYAGWNQIDQLNAQNSESEKNIHVPIVEEQLEARKTLRETGQVRIRKVVHTEFKSLRVPVMKEKIEIERVPAEGATAANLDASELKDETISIPVHEEELEVVKRPVLKEEIRVKKTTTQEEREVSGEVRKEDVEIEGLDEAEKRRRKTA